MSNSIVTQQSTLGDLCAAARFADESPGAMLEMLEHTPSWAATFDVENKGGRKAVTFGREVGTAEIRQSFYFDTWECADEEAAPVVAFYSYQEAREQGLPKPEATDVMRAMNLLVEHGAWPVGASS